MAIAVNVDYGLITPIIFDAGKKTIKEISLKTKEIAEKAKKNSLKPYEIIGGTITVSNVGMLGIKSCISVINPP